MTNFNRYLLCLLFALCACWFISTNGIPPTEVRNAEAITPAQTVFYDLTTYHAAPPMPASHNLALFGNPQSLTRLSQGKFLVASRKIKDPKFMETVILLLRHDLNGTLGLIVNRPTTVKLSDLLPEIKGQPGGEHFTYIGGPVGITQVFLLLRSQNKPEGCQWIFDDLYVSTSWNVFEQLLKTPAGKATFRTYAGYAGWGAGQLEQEVLRGDWRITDADADSIFKKPSSDIWRDLNRENEPIHIEL